MCYPFYDRADDNRTNMSNELLTLVTMMRRFNTPSRQCLRRETNRKQRASRLTLDAPEFSDWAMRNIPIHSAKMPTVTTHVIFSSRSSTPMVAWKNLAVSVSTAGIKSWDVHQQCPYRLSARSLVEYTIRIYTYPYGSIRIYIIFPKDFIVSRAFYALSTGLLRFGSLIPRLACRFVKTLLSLLLNRGKRIAALQSITISCGTGIVWSRSAKTVR